MLSAHVGIFVHRGVRAEKNSAGNSIGIQFGHETEEWATLSNTVIGMDLEVNSDTDILINKYSHMNEFIGVKAGYSSSPRVDGIEFNVTISNQTGSDTPVINFEGSLRYSGWSNPKAGNHRSMRFVYDAAFDYYTAIIVGQYDIAS